MNALTIWVIFVIAKLPGSFVIQENMKTISRIEIDSKRYVLLKQATEETAVDKKYVLVLVDRKGNTGDHCDIYSKHLPKIRVLSGSRHRKYIYMESYQEADEAEISLVKGLHFVSKWGDLSKGGIYTTFTKEGGVIIHVSRFGFQIYAPNDKRASRYMFEVYRFRHDRIEFLGNMPDK